MSHLQIEQRPELNQPLLIAAFSGWNDAGEAATGAIRFMLRRWRSERIARIDPEHFYDFTQARPRVRLRDGERILEWPENEFSFHPGEGERPDLVLMMGIEPHLAWQSYSETVLELCSELNVSTMVTLGALLSEVSHARPVKLSGSSEDPELRRLLDLDEPRLPGYQGPTGIVGVLNSLAKERGMRTASMWANVPHYVNASPNPKGTLALLEKLNGQLHLDLKLHDLEVFSARFDAQITKEVEKNQEMADYARRIEEQEDRESDDDVVPKQDDAGTLPDSSAVVDELERFLREQRENS